MDIAPGMLFCASRHQLTAQHNALLLIGSIAIVFVLFADASRINLLS